MKCKIQWIDSQCNPTPDNYDAVAMVFREAYIEQHGDHTHEMVRTEDFPICQNHLDMLAEMKRANPAAHHWQVNPLPPETYPAEFVNLLIDTGLEQSMRLVEAEELLHLIRTLVGKMTERFAKLEATGLDEILLACAGRSLDNPDDRYYLKSKLIAAVKGER